MKLLSRWFRRAPTAPSWIEPLALATRLEQDASLLVLDVRGPDEFTGPLGRIREARNLPLNELPAHLPDLVRDDRPVVVVCKTDRRSSMAAQNFHSGSRVPGGLTLNQSIRFSRLWWGTAQNSPTEPASFRFYFHRSCAETECA